MNTIRLMPEAASPFAGQVDAYFWFLIAVSLFFTLLIAAVLTFFAIRFRRRNATERGTGQHPSMLLEIAWSAIPFVLAMVMFFWATHLYFVSAKAPPNTMEILVTGKQWMWKLQHPTGRREVNTLHVPVGQPIKLTMTSEDVIHSFFVPAFRMKMDVVPGRYTTMWFHPTEVGDYRLLCAEYCGTEHSLMGGWVHVMEPEDYAAWISGVSGDLSPVEAGANLFSSLGCAACHNNQPGAQGPSLDNVFGHEVELADGTTVTADEDYIRRSILDPNADMVAGYQPIMPTFQGLVSEAQLMQLVAYVKSLSDGGSAGE